MSKQLIPMVDLVGQYRRIQAEVDASLQNCLASGRFIGGHNVTGFSDELAAYLNVKHVIPCGNGTDALQIACMGLNLKPGDEVIVPGFTYIATVEVLTLLGITPVLADVDPATFNLDIASTQNAITEKTKAIMPVHLFGQGSDMDALMALAKANNLFIIEDNAQSVGALHLGKNCSGSMGTIGDVGCLSFFPSKNLGAYGDGGAMLTNDDKLASSLQSICRHGQSKQKYYHDQIGVNSRLDALQAAVLRVKLKHLDAFVAARRAVASTYDEAFKHVAELTIPARASYSSHVFHQYTLRVAGGQRDALKKHLAEQGVSSTIYYPMPVYKQRAYAHLFPADFHLPVTEKLCEEVLSLPVHTELQPDQIEHIIDQVVQFFQ